jgi:lipoate-protein ligase A
MPAPDTQAPCRLMVDLPAAGAWNMAVDEVLLESAAENGRCSLRFYRWSEPTLSLGYFQRAAQRAAHAASRDCPMVRRQTGGGAILHDQELTYSLAMPVAHPLAEDPVRLYSTAHEALVSVLARFGVQATLCIEPAELAAADQPFLCFERRSPGDVLLGKSKICGSAQRRRRGAILQHGSLLLERSRQAPELPGIKELSGQTPEVALLIEILRQELACRLRLALDSQAFSPAESAEAQELAQEKYRVADWNCRR